MFLKADTLEEINRNKKIIFDNQFNKIFKIK